MDYSKTTLLSLFILLVFSSCNKDKRGITFSLQNEEEFVVSNGNPLNLPFNILIPEVETNSESQFKQNDTRADRINEIKLTTLVLSILNPASENFGFLKEIEIFIDADGLNEKRLAHRFNINSTEKTLELNSDNDDFAEFIKKDKYKLRVRTVVKSTFSNNVKVKANIAFKVKARVI